MGLEGVDKRIDVLSTAIYAGLTIQDLPNLDLAYAPPFSPAKDPIIVAGYSAENHLRGVEKISKVEELEADWVLLDVRSEAEIRVHGKLKGATNIELDELDNHLVQLNLKQKYAIYCAKGLRGYWATVRLKEKGYNVANMEGGYSLWSQIYDTESV